MCGPISTSDPVANGHHHGRIIRRERGIHADPKDLPGGATGSRSNTLGVQSDEAVQLLTRATQLFSSYRMKLHLAIASSVLWVGSILADDDISLYFDTV